MPVTVAADRVDVPADLVADDHRRFGCVRIEPEPRQDVREVHACGPDPDTDFALSGLGSGAAAHFEYVRWTVSRDDGLVHGEGGSRSAQEGIREP